MTGGPPSAAALAAVAVGAGAYAAAVGAGRRRGRGWPPRRSAWFALGAGALAVAVSPPVAAAAHADLRVHMAQHVVVAMLAPLALVLGAPVTAALRALPTAWARAVSRALGSRPARVASHPATALALNLGGMWALYATPLWGAMHHSPAVWAAVHAHMVAAGALFAWAVLAGPDPAPHAAPMGVRLGAVVAAMAGHAILSKGLVAQGWPAGHAPAEVLAAAQVMYYGGDLAEGLLLVALLAAWYRGDRRHTLGRWLPPRAPARAPARPSDSAIPAGLHRQRAPTPAERR